MSKPLFVSDGLIHVGIVAKSIEELHKIARRELCYQENTQVSIFRSNKKVVLSDEFQILEPFENLIVMPKCDIKFSVRNLLKKLKFRADNILLFSDKDIVTLAKMNVNEHSAYEDIDFLKGVKELAISHIQEEQELRDSLGLAYLANKEDPKSKPFKCSLEDPTDLSDMISKILENPQMIKSIGNEVLISLHNINLDEFYPSYGPSARLVKEAATRRQILNVRIKEATHFLETKANFETKEGKTKAIGSQGISELDKAEGKSKAFDCRHKISQDHLENLLSECEQNENSIRRIKQFQKHIKIYQDAKDEFHRGKLKEQYFLAQKSKIEDM